MDISDTDRSRLLERARRQRRVLRLAAVASGVACVAMIVGVLNASSGGNVHWPLLLAALIAGATAVPAASTARRLDAAIRGATADRAP